MSFGTIFLQSLFFLSLCTSCPHASQTSRPVFKGEAQAQAQQTHSPGMRGSLHCSHEAEKESSSSLDRLGACAGKRLGLYGSQVSQVSLVRKLLSPAMSSKAKEFPEIWLQWYRECSRIMALSIAVSAPSPRKSPRVWGGGGSVHPHKSRSGDPFQAPQMLSHGRTRTCLLKSLTLCRKTSSHEKL